MTTMTLPSDAPRRRSRWPLFLMPILLVIAAAAWSLFWFYAASQAEVKADAWRAQEAKSGRSFECAKQSIGGFPFRIEVRCEGARITLTSQTAGAAQPVTINLAEILAVAQVYAPKLLIAEFHAPAAISEIAKRACDAGELEDGARERGWIACRSAACLDRFR